MDIVAKVTASAKGAATVLGPNSSVIFSTNLRGMFSRRGPIRYRDLALGLHTTPKAVHNLKNTEPAVYLERVHSVILVMASLKSTDFKTTLDELFPVTLQAASSPSVNALGEASSLSQVKVQLFRYSRDVRFSEHTFEILGKRFELFANGFLRIETPQEVIYLSLNHRDTYGFMVAEYKAGRIQGNEDFVFIDNSWHPDNNPLSRPAPELSEPLARHIAFMRTDSRSNSFVSAVAHTFNAMSRVFLAEKRPLVDWGGCDFADRAPITRSSAAQPNSCLLYTSPSPRDS